MNLQIHPSSISGRLSIPSSKSQTLRALFFAAFAKSPSVINHPLICDDSLAMIECLETLGAKFFDDKESIKVVPTHLNEIQGPIRLNVKNSGITFRFMTALAALIPCVTTIDGDESIRKKRPIASLIKTLQSLGVEIQFLNPPDHAPIEIRGGLKNSDCEIRSNDSQPITALFYLAALSKKDFGINFYDCEEKPWLELSFAWMKLLNLPANKTESTFSILKNDGYDGFIYNVPGDLSALAFFVGLSIIHQQRFTVDHVDLNDLQPDQSILEIFEQLGGEIAYEHTIHRLVLIPPINPSGFTFDLEKGIDLLPILATVACFLKSPTHLFNGKIARFKESDRIQSMASELKKMGAMVEENEDGLKIYPSQLHGASVRSKSDHRIAMSLIIAATKASSHSSLSDFNCIRKTFPDFIKVMQSLNGTLIL